MKPGEVSDQLRDYGFSLRAVLRLGYGFVVRSEISAKYETSKKYIFYSR
jgi:hypothetical protein